MSEADDDYTERLVSRLPVTVRRRVLWGECDPAQVVYTPRFSDYLIAAFLWFQRIILDAGAPTLADANLSTPMKAMALEFHRTLRPDDIFEMTVLIGDIRSRTFDLDVTARTPAGETLFIGRMSPIFINRDQFKGVEIPSPFRERLEYYRAALSG